MNLDQVISALQAHKGAGNWQVIASKSGIHYDTLARIARGSITNPSIQTIQKITLALASMKRPRPAKVAPSAPAKAEQA